MQKYDSKGRGKQGSQSDSSYNKNKQGHRSDAPSGRGKQGYQGDSSYNKDRGYRSDAPSGRGKQGYQGDSSYNKDRGYRSDASSGRGKQGYQGDSSYNKDRGYRSDAPSGRGKQGYQGDSSYNKDRGYRSDAPSGRGKQSYQGDSSYNKDKGYRSDAPRGKRDFEPSRRPPLPKKQAEMLQKQAREASPMGEEAAVEQQPLRDDLVIGRNSVVELLKAGRPVEAVYITPGGQGSLSRIVAMAKERNIPVKDASPTKLDYLCAGANHQGVAAITSGAEYAEMEDIFARAGSDPVFLVIADEIEDPHNLGAIIRTAEAAGAHGLIIPKRRSAGLSFAVHKASAGAAEHLPVVRVANLATTIEELKKKGVWIYAADMDGSTWCETDFSGPVGLVIGSEGSGVGRLIKEKSDFVVSLPLCGQINSLNASVAAGILLYEVARQRLHLKAR